MKKALGSTLEKDNLVLYIHDSKTRQTQGPFSLWNDADIVLFSSTKNRLLPVYSAVQQNEPEFLIVNWFLLDGLWGLPGVIDLRALSNSSSEEAWSRFSLPKDIPVGTDLDSSCRNHGASRRLIIAGIVSSVFGIAMLVFLCNWRWRKRRLKATDADQNSLQIVQDEEQELDDRSKDAEAPIQNDTWT